jgi:hypothetical protein
VEARLSERERGHCYYSSPSKQASLNQTVPLIIISCYIQMWVEVRGSKASTDLRHKDKPHLDSLKGNYRDCQELMPAFL